MHGDSIGHLSVKLYLQLSAGKGSRTPTPFRIPRLKRGAYRKRHWVLSSAVFVYTSRCDWNRPLIRTQLTALRFAFFSIYRNNDPATV